MLFSRLCRRVLLTIVLVLPLLLIAQNQAAAPVSFSDSFAPAEFAQIEPWLKNSRIIGAGEATHGTHEFGLYRKNLFRYLVQTGQTRAFFLEADAGCCFAINRYIQGDTGNPESLIKNIRLWPFINDDLIDIVKWMRSYNDVHPTDKLRFQGADVQFIQDDIGLYFQYGRNVLSAKDSQFLTTLKKIQADTLAKHFPDSFFSYVSQLNRMECELNDEMQNGEILRGFLRGMKQYMHLHSPEKTYNTRDSFMAENMLYFNSMYPEKGIFYYAHNGHVAKIRNARYGMRTGYYLGKKYPEYLAIGAECFSGQFRAVGKNFKTNTYTPGIFTLPEPRRKTLSHILHKKYGQNLALQTAVFPKYKKMNVTMIGAVFYQEFPHRARKILSQPLFHCFDIIVYTERSSPITYLGKQK
ncbi:MAG: erythromycin esterase family protein [Bacteroidetes bacterium]|nr:erythromycin esterase family protein [Bacteroidota bacterium]